MIVIVTGAMGLGRTVPVVGEMGVDLLIGVGNGIGVISGLRSRYLAAVHTSRCFAPEGFRKCFW